MYEISPTTWFLDNITTITTITRLISQQSQHAGADKAGDTDDVYGLGDNNEQTNDKEEYDELELATYLHQ